MTIPNIRPWNIVNGHEFFIETKHEVMNGSSFEWFQLDFFSSKNDGELFFSIRGLIGSPKGEKSWTHTIYLGAGFNLSIFNPIWGRFRFWLIFFKWVGSTTNQNIPLVSGLTYHPATSSFIQTFQYQFHPWWAGIEEKPKTKVPGGPF